MDNFTVAEKFYLDSHANQDAKILAKVLRQDNPGLKLKDVRAYLKAHPYVAPAAPSPPPQRDPEPMKLAKVFQQKTAIKKDNVIVSSSAASSIGDTYRTGSTLEKNPNVFYFNKD